MRKSRLILKELEEALVFWEDFFLIQRLYSKSKKLKDPRFDNIISGLTIPNGLEHVAKFYSEFRRDIYERRNIDPKKFLPSIPKNMDSIDLIDYVRTAPINVPSLVFYPYMIANWLKTKKVFHIDPGIVPLVSPKKRNIRDLFTKKNFLSLLPCDAFVIYFTKSLELELESFPTIKRYKCCIVCRSENMIDTFWLPNDVEQKSMQQTGRELIRKVIAKKGIRDNELKKLQVLSETLMLSGGIRVDLVSDNLLQVAAEPAYFTIISFLIDQPYCFLAPATSEKGYVRIYRDVFSKPPVQYEESSGRYKKINTLVAGNKAEEILINERVRFEKFFFEFINGFCFALSQIKPRNPEVIDSVNNSESNNFSLAFSWNEIPITQVLYLQESEDIDIKISYGSGEKSPHIRRGHWRHLVKKDGTIIKIWIDQITVRVDKLEKGEYLKGSVASVREKRK